MPSFDYKSLIKDTENFPQPGILFRDVSPMLAHAEALQNLIKDLTQLIDINKVDAFVGIESRGFIFASLLAAKLSKGFIPLRKAGKLPPPVIAKTYNLEYGQATLEIAPSASYRPLRVVICDDVLATGGTLNASVELCEEAGYIIEDIIVLINLTSLNKVQFNNQPIKSIIQYS